MRTRNIRDGLNSQLMPDNMTFRFGEYTTLPTCDATRKNHAAVQGGGMWLCDGTRWLTLGNGITGSTTTDPPSTGSGSAYSVSLTVTGAAVGDYALCSHTSLSGGWDLDMASVSAADTVRCVFRNNTGGTSNPASGTLSAIVMQG